MSTYRLYMSMIIMISLFSLVACGNRSRVQIQKEDAQRQAMDITGTWVGKWKSQVISESFGTFDCFIRTESFGWVLSGQIIAHDGTDTRNVMMNGKMHNGVVKFTGSVEDIAQGTFHFTALCADDSLRGVYKGRGDEGSFRLEKK